MTKPRSPTTRAVLLLLVGLGFAGAGAERFADASTADQGYLAALISSLLSSGNAKVSIGEVEGALSSVITVRNVVIADSQGQWFHLDRVRLVWNSGALFSRRLEVESLEIGNVELTRKPMSPLPAASSPVAPAGVVPAVSATSVQTLRLPLPELPFTVVVKEFSLAKLDLDEAVLGVAALLSATGSVLLGKYSDELQLELVARRQDSPGELAVRLSFVPEKHALDLVAKLDEPSGGFLAKLAKLPDTPPVHLDLVGTGSLD
ncbi:MAG: hypothetical protein WCK65_13965, partial [Rhodospirillaceae bacterium]